MKKDFNEWLLTFKDNISTYEYYTDFAKVYKNVDDIKVELNILNSLIGSKNIKNDFMNLIYKYPDVLNAIPILLAKRESEIKITEPSSEAIFTFSRQINHLSDYVKFMEKTGLFELLQNHLINNLVDYVIGVEVGMDTNARKNRIGHIMENLVEEYLVSKGLVKDRDYFKEMTSSEIQKRFGINLSGVNEIKAEKRFDFVVYKNNTVFALEVNFYSSGGSKLNETARSYKQLALETKEIDNFKFMWITDGAGWKSAKNNLQETYLELEDIANLADLSDGIFDKYFCS